MIANVEGVMIHEYLQRRPGRVPSKQQLGAFVASLSEAEVLHVVRGHPSVRSLLANMRNDAEILRWAGALTNG
jgi:hypothetical protein